MYLHTDTQRAILKSITGQERTSLEVVLFEDFCRELMVLEQVRAIPPATEQRLTAPRERFKPRLVEA